MFGYVVVNKPEMKFKEFDVYHAYYCGLCKTIKNSYGEKCPLCHASFKKTSRVL